MMSAPPGHWLFGHIPALRSDPLGLLDACRGPVARLRLGRPAWLLLEPADISHVLNESEDGYSKGQAFRHGRRLYGNSLLVSEGPEHRRQLRRVGGPFFRHAARDFVEPAVAVANRLARRWHCGQRIDLWAAMNDLTLAISARAIFGDDLLPGWLRDDGDARANSVLQAFDTAMAHVARQTFSLLPLPDWVPTPANRRYRRALTLLDEAFDQAVRRRRLGESSGGFLDHLLEARDGDGRMLSLQEVRDQSLVLTLGGYESTATALCWALLLIGRESGVHERLLAEVCATAGDRPLVPEDIASLTYTGQVFSESLRLYPPPWLIPRTALRDDRLPSGMRLAVGSQVFLSPYCTQREERFYPEPLRFDPGRFAAPGSSAPSGTYFPFGAGPRHCIGESIARAQAVLILATLSRSWRFIPETVSLPGPKPLLTLRPPVPLWVTVKAATGRQFPRE